MGGFAGDLRTIEKAIRRIARASDVQSRALSRAAGLTAAQLVALKGVRALGEVTTNTLSAYADISAATLITILDNLEERGAIERYRSSTDRRIVHTRLTGRGEAMLDDAPEPLGTAFVERLAALPEQDRRRIVDSLSELARLMSPEAP
ncbi:MAG: MarR family winged helix-turn-helix transcriptional regulator [Rhizobiaceae bacterium]|nr:MarR family winged helix-turn-helix transcriptional regulator [Rhizobiaceae bacterium]MCV0405920.1 MarR family winged helix-turn-helix transcriptional regulator [Rhizobiaceae bacterium]